MTARLAGERLLLDTNVALWLLFGDRHRISPEMESILADEQYELLLSAVSVWEIAIKRSLGKLDIADGWSGALQRLDFHALPATAEHTAHVEQLPWHHRDPFDRLLVAQAQIERCSLVTADARLSAYDVPVVWA